MDAAPGVAGLEVESEQTAATAEDAVARGDRRRNSGMSLALTVLAGIALVAALYLARAFFVPLLIGILTSYALRPVVDWLEAHYVPRAAGAALALLAVVGSLSWIGYALSGDTAAMIERLPEAARKLRQEMSVSRASGKKTPLQNMQEAANEIQGATADATLKPGKRAAAVRTPESSVWLRDYAVAQSRLLITVAAQTPMVLLLAYFLLASGVHFRRKLVYLVGPSLSRKKDAVRMLEEIDSQVQRYLLVMLLSNTLVGIGTWLAFEALGMEHAGVWGVAAGVLHFIPYLGSALMVLGSGVAAFLQFGSTLHALAIPGAALLVAAAIGHVFVTWLQSRAARVNAAVLFIALLFFGWLWGVWGLLLGAPLLAIVKVICDRIEALKSVGELLGQ
ncbi:MAG: AI-2E family transporter [Burkholderiales bacterium]|nr:AI-2E family transporter [Burkholderiales bacterium]